MIFIQDKDVFRRRGYVNIWQGAQMIEGLEMEL